MRDLYKRLGVPPTASRESIEQSLPRADPQTRRDAEHILLHERRRGVYDVNRTALENIGALRAGLGLDQTSAWLDSGAEEFTPREPTARRKPAEYETFGKSLSWKSVIFIALAVLTLGRLVIRIANQPAEGRRDQPAPPRSRYEGHWPGEEPKPVYVEPPVVGVGDTRHVVVGTLNLRAGPGSTSERVGTLGQFDTVEVVGSQSEGWLRVATAEGDTGWVAAEYLESGNGEVARDRWCRAEAGERPESGAVLLQRGSGHHRLEVRNAGLDSVIKLKRTDESVLAFYVRGGETAAIPNVPEGAFKVVWGTGSSWSHACDRFMDDFSVAIIDERAQFETTENSVAYYSTNLTYELIRRPGGNLTIQPASPEEFAN